MRRKSADLFCWLFAAVALLAGVLLLGALPVRAATSSERFVQNTIERAYAIVDDRSLDEGQRNRKLHDFLRSVADVRRIALFTAGRSARLASEHDINYFVKALEGYLVARGRDALIKFRNNPITVTGSTARARDDVIVNARVSSAIGSIGVGFRVRKDRDDKDVIVDFQTEGISLAIMGRVAFALFLLAHEEKLSLLSEDLNRQTARIEADDPAAATSAR
jgi:ABC-type transporter MlaC component